MLEGADSTTMKNDVINIGSKYWHYIMLAKTRNIDSVF